MKASDVDKQQRLAAWNASQLRIARGRLARAETAAMEMARDDVGAREEVSAALDDVVAWAATCGVKP